jgi:hypothetical protein
LFGDENWQITTFHSSNYGSHTINLPAEEKGAMGIIWWYNQAGSDYI